MGMLVNVCVCVCVRVCVCVVLQCDAKVCRAIKRTTNLYMNIIDGRSMYHRFSLQPREFSTHIRAKSEQECGCDVGAISDGSNMRMRKGLW